MKHLTAFNIKEYLANTPQITFEVTEACNLACVYCGYGSLYNDKDPRSNRKLCAIDAISFLKYMKTLWNEGYRGTESNVLHISFYGGEPLLNMPLIKKIVDYSERELRKYKKVIIYSLTTNALLLPINIEYLVSKEFRILISLDGNREGNKYRIYQDGRPAYDKILESIDFVRNNYPTYFQNNVEFNSVLNNFNSVKTLRSYFIQNYNKTPSIGEINTSGIHPKQTDFFKKIYKSKIESEEEAALDSNSTYYQDSPDYPRIARYLQTHSPFFYSDYNELLLGKNKQEKLPTGTGDNSDWFNHNVMMTLQDIDTTKLSYDDLFRNEKLNSSCFGILEILSDGHIYALNAKKQLGTTSTYLSEIVEKELRENTSWRITRKVYDGCRNCRYRILCPPVSSYEMLYKTTPKCLIKK